MIPTMLDPRRLRIGLVGRGALALKRLDWFGRLGAAPEIFSDAPAPDLVAAAGDRLVRRLPDEADLARLNVVWIADLGDAARPLARRARAAKALVNVEDDPDYCDFHTPAAIRRGRLVLAVGTGGASPAAAAAVRAKLEADFPDEWAETLERIAAARRALIDAGASPGEIAADARRRLAEAGLI